MTKRVLLIEDDHVQIELITHIFNDQFPHVALLVARSGEEGVEILKTTSVNMVLLDLMLPSMHGLEVMKHVSQQNPRPTVVVISADDTKTTELKVHLAGVDVFMMKPFDIHVLVSLIKSTLIEYD
jgi:two-component system response regulator VanR